jgi:hypothetical protein
MRPLASLILALAVAGCSGLSVSSTSSGSSDSTSSGSSDSAAGTAAGATSSSRPTTQVAQAQRTHEYPAPAPRLTARAHAPTAVVAIEAFAGVYINWSASSLAHSMRALEAISVGQARSMVALTASQAAHDYELQRGGVANAGVVEAIAPVLGRQDEYAVVTRERTTATNNRAYQGLPAAWHLSLATVSRLDGGGWVVSGWQPEN